MQYALLPSLTRQYIVQELPRISQYGPWGPAEWLLPEQDILREQHWNSAIAKGNHVYLREGFDNSLTASNASLARFLSSWVTSLSATLSTLSLGTFLLLFGLTLWLLRAVRLAALGLEQMFLFWLLALSIVLLSAPLTWSMATVWLLPVCLTVPSFGTKVRGPTDMLALGALVTGLVLLVLDERPFAFFFARLLPLMRDCVSLKYILAQVLVSSAIVVYLRRDSSTQAIEWKLLP